MDALRVEVVPIVVGALRIVSKKVAELVEDA